MPRALKTLLMLAPVIALLAPSAAAQRFDARALVAASDLDMAGTAYADGRLHPLPGEADAVTVYSDFGADGPDATVAVEASNSVMGWPGALDLSPDGRRAYVVETRGRAPEGASQVDVWAEMAEGALLTTLDISDPTAPVRLDARPVGRDPGSVHVAPDGRWLAVATRDAARELVIVALDENGVPNEVRGLDLDLPDLSRRPQDEGVVYLRLDPTGEHVALNLANTHIGFARLTFDANGLPDGAALIGAPVDSEGWIAMGRWTRDGRAFLAADTGWGPRDIDAAFNGPGAIVSIGFDPGGAHRVIDRARTSHSPEGFDMSPDGDLLIVVNMERSYLPGGFPFFILPRRGFSSLSLVRVDQETAALETLGRPLRFQGVLPEDAVFDADGDMVAVAVFHPRERSPRTGFVELFAITGGDAPRLEATGTRLPAPRGAHDVEVVY